MQMRRYVMATLRSRCRHYIFALWFLLLLLLSFFPFVSDIAIFVLKRDVKLQLTNLFSLPNLSRHRLDVYHAHMMWP